MDDSTGEMWPPMAVPRCWDQIRPEAQNAVTFRVSSTIEMMSFKSKCLFPSPFSVLTTPRNVRKYFIRVFVSTVICVESRLIFLVWQYSDNRFRTASKILVVGKDVKNPTRSWFLAMSSCWTGALCKKSNNLCQNFGVRSSPNCDVQVVCRISKRMIPTLMDKLLMRLPVWLTIGLPVLYCFFCFSRTYARGSCALAVIAHLYLEGTCCLMSTRYCASKSCSVVHSLLNTSSSDQTLFIDWM